MKLFPLFLSLLLSACLVQPSPSPSFSGSLNKPTVVCEQLSQIKQVHDLINQLHQHLNSDCLFIAKASDLETIWQVPVVDLPISPFDQHKHPEIQPHFHRFQQLYQQNQTFFILRNMGFSTWHQISPHPQITLIIQPNFVKTQQKQLFQYAQSADKKVAETCYQKPCRTAHIWQNQARDVKKAHLVFIQHDDLIDEIILYRHANSSDFPFYQTD